MCPNTCRRDLYAVTDSAIEVSSYLLFIVNKVLKEKKHRHDKKAKTLSQMYGTLTKSENYEKRKQDR